ncbi:conserved hypothetical protein [Rhodococcus sp. RD6.2]|uniref:DUF6474 family protein n=1 Tax=Rhodococcus sp. RD6.2 TaxID=260936 RepID=UPI00063B0AF2|nr:DUF6474 family protein [Rhodococcus sp. RD6.2]CRK53927.1 conserved hypothetical protein [Rhodococcus sp. RD6.2]
MGLFRKRKTRATRRAEAKALKHKAKLEAKHGARNDRKKLRSETKSAKKVEKAQLATLKAQEKAASKTGITASQVKRYLGIARLLTPVLLPLVYRGTVLARTQLDQQRAHRLGVAPEELGAYTGHGARLSARIAGAERTADEIAKRQPDADTAKFTAAVRGRLAELDTAVHAAELMPTQRRKSAHLAIATELDGVEADLLAKLGVH